MGILSSIGNYIDTLGTKHNLPEFGVSELLSGGSPTANTGSKPFSQGTYQGPTLNKAFFDTALQAKQANNTRTQADAYTTKLQTQNKANSGVGSAGVGGSPIGGGVGGGAVASGGNFSGVGQAAPSLSLAQAQTNAYGLQPNQSAAAGVPTPLDLIDQKFQSEQQALGQQANQVNSQFGDTQNMLQSQLQGALGQVGTEEQNRNQAINTGYDQAHNQLGVQQAQQEQQAKQLLGDLQQRQAAQLSAGGNYSSSVADASNDQLGKQAFSTLNNIQNARSSGEQNILGQKTDQLAKVSDFYARTRQDLNGQYQTALNQLLQQRDQKLAAVAQNQNASAQAKAANTAQAWNDYLSQKRQVDMATYQNAQALDMWKQQQEFALQQALNYRAAGIQSPSNSYSPIQDFTGNVTGAFNKQTGQVNPIGQATRSTGPANPEDQLQLGNDVFAQANALPQL